MRGSAYQGLAQTPPALRSAAAEFRLLCLADGRGLPRGPDGGVLILEPDDIAGPDHPRQFDGVPVRQSDAAVGLGLAYD
jgi:hypothetical protein